MDFIQLYIITNFRIYVLYISTHYSFYLYIFLSLHLCLQPCLPVFISRYKWCMSTPKPWLWGSAMRQGGPSFMTTSLLDQKFLARATALGSHFCHSPVPPLPITLLWLTVMSLMSQTFLELPGEIPRCIIPFSYFSAHFQKSLEPGCFSNGWPSTLHYWELVSPFRDRLRWESILLGHAFKQGDEFPSHPFFLPP